MKTIEIRFFAEMDNDHITYRDIENFLYINFQNYCNVKRVDLLEYKEENTDNTTKYFDEDDQESEYIPF